MKGKKWIKNRFVAIVLTAVFAITPWADGGVAASTILQLPKGTQPESTGNFTPKLEQPGDYKEATNTFTDGNPTYYLITQQDGKKNSVTEVQYNGVTYPIAEVLVGDRLDKLKVTGDTWPVADYRATGNRTFFIDEGTYTDGNHANYTNLSIENRSMVGLYKNDSGEPAAIITKAAYPANYYVAQAQDCIERYNIEKKNVYFENLIFDGTGKDLLPLGDKSVGIGKNRGEYMFFLTAGTDGFVMRDVIIQNVGKDLSQPGSFFNTAFVRKNVAINVYRSGDQHNFENVTIRTIKTKSGFGIISLNQAKNNYFKDITIDASVADPNSRSVKVEVMNNNTAAMALAENQVVFSTSLNLPDDPMHNHVYVQDYRYKGVVVPQDFRYAKWKTSNGSNYQDSFLIYKAWPGADSSSAIHDLQDQYWVVDAAASIGVDSQLGNIKRVMEYTSQGVFPGRSPNANIKMALHGSTALPSFVLPPNSSNNLGDYVTPTNIVATTNLFDLYTQTAWIPFVANGTITKMRAKDKLYNFDFHVNAKYTLHEATEGITPLAAAGLKDPVELLYSNNGNTLPAYLKGYPLYSTYKPTPAVDKKVTESTADTFVNCKFTTLAKTLTGNTAQTIPVSSSSALGVSVDSGYTGPGAPWNDRPATEVDDPSIAYYSDNTSIATVDDDGKITGVAPGTVKIYAKAKDRYNNGEIEKPFLIIQVEVVQQKYTLTYDGNGNEGGTVPGSVTENSGTEVTVAGNTGTLTKTGYEFTGWNTAADGTGTSYAPDSTLKLEGNTTFYAVWNPILSYNGNGSTGGSVPEDAAVKAGEDSTVAAQGDLVKEGYTFAGWNTAADGSGAAYPGGSSIAIQEPTTLYAQWTKINDVVLHYDGNGSSSGNAPGDQSVQPGGNLTAANQNTLVKKGYLFAGWNTKADGSGTAYQPGATIPMNGNTTLYAQWVQAHTVTYDVCGGSGSAPSEQVTTGSSVILDPQNQGATLTKEGYTFGGWSTDPKGGGPVYQSGTEIPVSGDVTFYAVWTPAEQRFTLGYDANGGVGHIPESVTIKKGEEVRVAEAGDLTREGSLFVGWNTASNGTGSFYRPGDVVRIDGDLRLYAQWAKKADPSSLSLIYHGNGNTAGRAPSGVTLSTPGALTVEGPGDLQRDGYRFVGWNTAAVGSGTWYQPGDSIWVQEGTALYARWEALEGPKNITLTYHGNGAAAGTVPAAVTLSTPGALAVGDSGGLIRDGYRFVGWNTKADGSGAWYHPGDSLFLRANTALYAQWEKILIPPAPGSTGSFSGGYPSFVPPGKEQSPESPLAQGQAPKTDLVLDRENHSAYLDGYPDGTAKPARFVTRGEVAAIFSKLTVNKEDIDNFDGTTVFRDVKSSGWHARYIRFITEHNVMVGYPDGTFRPDALITRGEFAAVVSKFEQLSQGEAPFTDIEKHWSRDYVRSAYTKGWIHGYPDGTFKPGGSISREEAAATINQMLGRCVDQAGVGTQKVTWLYDLKPGDWSFYHMIEATNSHLYTRRKAGEVQEDWTEVKRHRAPQIFVPLAEYGVK